MEEKYKILAVDDNPINLKLLSRALINTNYEIYTASSGEEALKVAREVVPDLILLDVMMPGMDGYQVCKKLQEDPHTAFIPVIFLSAKNEPVDKAKGLALGAVDYLTKPFNPLEINARVRTHLSARQSTIHLLRKNQALSEELEKLKKQLKRQEDEQLLIDHLQKISSSSFHVDQDSVEILSVAKNNNFPITSVHIPVFESKDLNAILILNGFEKDYPTLTVEQLIQKFVEGFFNGIDVTKNDIDADALSALFNTLIERFSPDIYQVAFTFATIFINASAQKLYFYGLNLNGPYEISPDAPPRWPNAELITIDSELRNFITAYKAPIHSGQRFVHFLAGSNPVDESIYQKIFVPALKNNNYHLQKSALYLEENLPEQEEDQSFLIMAIK
jgi:CheY-like chemotaxis protein